MRDRDDRPSLREALERGLHRTLGLRVERGRRLVENEDRGVAQDRPRDRDPLLLPAREPVAALADDGLVAVRQRRDQIVDLSRAGGVLDLLVRRVRSGEAEVLAHGRVEEIGLLRDDADGLGERVEGQLAHVDSVDRHRSAGRVVEARDEVGAGRLARARLAHERRLGPRGHRNDTSSSVHARLSKAGIRPSGPPREIPRLRRGQVPKGRRFASGHRGRIDLVSEPDVLERDVAARPLDRPRPLDDVDRLVEVLEDPVEQRERALHLELDAEQAPDREEESCLQRRERHERADRDRGRAALDRPAGEQVDEGGHHGERRLDRGHHPAAGHAAPHLEPGEALRLRLEPQGEVAGAAHRLAEQDPRYRERLLDDRGDVGERYLSLGRHLPALVAHALRQPDEEGQQHERERRKPPVEQHHRDHRRDDSRDVRQHRRRGGRDNVFDTADVVRDSALHFARARAGEEGQ